MFALDALLAAYPDAKFLWSHRDPAKVLGSVCSLIHYTRSWASDRDDSMELGAEELGRWADAIDRAMDFRARIGEDRFADLAWTDLQTNPTGALETAYERIGIGFSDASRAAVTSWAERHEPGAHGRHAYELAQFGLEAGQVHEAFARYLETYDAAS
jgi:hypothetical protein